MKSLWKKWCDKVEVHNTKQTYATHEEVWTPGTIFLPIAMGIIITTAISAFGLLYGARITLKVVITTFLIVTAAFGVMLYLNWKAYD